MFTAIGCYFLAKYHDKQGNKPERDLYHACTHCFWTLMHMGIIYEAAIFAYDISSQALSYSNPEALMVDI